MIIAKQKITRAIKYRINFLCGDFPVFGGRGIPQLGQFLSPGSILPPQCLQARLFIIF
jgi:hypothetical protein